jgi:hypothetical protein
MRLTTEEWERLADAFENWTEGNAGNPGNEEERALLEKIENHIEPKYVEITLGWFEG